MHLWLSPLNDLIYSATASSLVWSPGATSQVIKYFVALFDRAVGRRSWDTTEFLLHGRSWVSWHVSKALPPAVAKLALAVERVLDAFVTGSAGSPLSNHSGRPS
jgi:hypothetical protein